jgi:hypothetical protein
MRHLMRRPILGVTVLGLVLATAGALLLVLRPPAPRIGSESFDAIRKGMTQPEVEAVIGVPPGDYRTRKWGLIIDPVGGGTLMMADLHRVESWLGNTGIIHVAFDEDGKVCWKHFVPAVPGMRLTPLARLRRRLGL